MVADISLKEPAKPFRFKLYLLLLVSSTFAIYIAFAWYAKAHWQDIAPQFSANSVFNQKILYIRSIWKNKDPAVLVIGSSMALNNFDSDRLSVVQRERVINLGATGLSLSSSRNLFSLVSNGIPAKQIIIVTQFNEMRNQDDENFSMPATVFRSYVSEKMNFIEEFSYRDLSSMFGSAQKRDNWLKYRNDYSSAAFTSSGAVPLQIYGAAIPQVRWNGDNINQQEVCINCRRALDQLCRTALRVDRHVTIVIPPISPHLSATRPAIKVRYDQQRSAMAQTAQACGARAFDVGAFARFDDACFADSIHLNAEGARALTDLFIRWTKQLLISGQSDIRCRPNLPSKTGRALGGDFALNRLQGQGWTEPTKLGELSRYE